MTSRQHTCLIVDQALPVLLSRKYLQTLVYKNQLDWPKYLPGIFMAYRATPAANSIGFSQYFLCFAKDMVFPFDNVINSTVDASPNFMSYWPQTILDLRWHFTEHTSCIMASNSHIVIKVKYCCIILYITLQVLYVHVSKSQRKDLSVVIQENQQTGSSVDKCFAVRVTCI